MLHAFLIAAAILAATAVVATALAVLVIADLDKRPYRVAGRFLLNPIAIRHLARTQPDLVAGYAEYGYTTWADIVGLRERGWTPQILGAMPDFIRVQGHELIFWRTLVTTLTEPAFTAFATPGRKSGRSTVDLPAPPADLQAWYDLLGDDAPAGLAAGLTLAEAQQMAAAGTLDGPTVRAMAALRAPAT